MKNLVLVSACLAGLKVRYNGQSKDNRVALKLFKEGRAVLVCPEVFGRLKVPRESAEIEKYNDGKDVLLKTARIYTQEGKDVTKNYLLGAKMVLDIAKKYQIKQFLFCDKSPSCGYKQVYDGSFSHKLKNGIGVTTSLLLKNGLKPYNIK